MTLFDDEARGFDQAPSGLPDPDMHLDRLSHLLRLAEDWAYKDIPLYVKIDGTDVPINYRYCTTQGVYFAPAVAPPLRAVDAPVNPVGRNHPETAKRQGKRMAPRLGSKRRQAYDFIAERGTLGATAREVGEHFGWEHQSYSPAVSTLKTDGWIKVDIGLPGTGDLTRERDGADVMVIARQVTE